MQPAPLTGTATQDGQREPDDQQRCSPHPSRGQQLRGQSGYTRVYDDAARTPHGDSNSEISRHITLVSWMQPAPPTGTTTIPGGPLACPARCSPHPSRGQQLQPESRRKASLWRCSPRPSRGQQPARPRHANARPGGCSPCPSRGQQPPKSCAWGRPRSGCSPHTSRGQRQDELCPGLDHAMVQPVPLTWTATFSMNFSPCVAVMQPAPLTGTTTLSGFGLSVTFSLTMQPAPLTGTATDSRHPSQRP